MFKKKIILQKKISSYLCFCFFSQTEAKAEELQQTLAALEDELDAAESRLAALTGQLTEEEKKAEEARRAHKELENRGQTDYSRLNRLEKELEELNAKNEEVVEKFENVSILYNIHLRIKE